MKIKGMMKKNVDALKIILRFLWDNPNSSVGEIAKFINETAERVSKTYIPSLKRFHLIQFSGFNRYEITERGMLFIDIKPAEQTLGETVLENEKKKLEVEKDELVPPKPITQEIIVEPKRQIKITIEIT